jgi:UDP:flavonoid glycosyltransferase YjiC (YdhE family)
LSRRTTVTVVERDEKRQEMRSGRFLLTCHDAGGTVPPMLALAQALVDRGHRVVILSQPSVRERAEASGCDFAAFSAVSDYARDKTIEEQIAVAVPVITGKAVGDDLLGMARAHAVDLVVVDGNLAGGLAAAETLEQPSVVLLHSMYAAFVDTWFAEIWPLLGPVINETRDRYGLAPAPGWASVFSGHDRLLSVVPAVFEAPVADPPAAMRHFGFLSPRPSPADDAPGFPRGDGPAVLVGLSTTYQRQEPLLRSILEALDVLGVRGLVTTAGHVDVGTLRVPPNVVVEEYVAHPLLLPQTDVMVSHAGLGSVAAALTFGVPMVCAPIGRDQPLNAERVATLGAGLALPVEATVGQLAQAIEEVLSQPSYRRAAQGIAAASRRDGGPSAVADELESLLT